MRLDCGICPIRPYGRDDKPGVARQANNRKVWMNVRDVFPHPYAFRLERIYATPFHWNVASARALEKASFTREGVMRRAAIKDGVIADMPLYARLKTPAILAKARFEDFADLKVVFAGSGRRADCSA